MRRLLFILPLLLAAESSPENNSLLLEAIHAGDTRAVRAALKSGADANTRDALGTTPLMHAGAYAPVECMRLLLAAGADANAASNAGFTPLMWSVSGPEKVRLLLSKGADVKARSKDGNTAVILARQNGFTDAVPLLLTAGALDEDGMDTLGRPLLQIARDQLLQIRSIGIEPMHLVAVNKPMFAAVHLSGGTAEPVFALLHAGVDPNAPVQIRALTIPPLAFAAHFGNVSQVRALLEAGANPNARASRGLTPLMVAVMADFQNAAVVDMLLNKGAAIDARDDLGRTALDWASLQGETPTVRQLRAAGAHSMAAPNPAPAPVVEPRTAREAIEKALALLQTSGPVFFRQSDGCISCHHNSLPAIAVKRAIDKRVAVNTALATHSSKAAMATWRPVQENMAIGASSVPGMVANLGYELMALAEERFPRNFVTDAAALGLARLQRSDGSWTIADGRPPIAGSDIMWTALAVHGLQAYMPPGLQGAKEAAIRRARNYLLEAPARTTQDAAFLVLGLRWTGVPHSAVGKYRDGLLALQREDGGWGQLPTMSSDAYATGQALYALESAGVRPSAPAYRRGIDHLLRTQLADGSWFVRSRGLGFQPYQETGFPHGRDQFISAAATSWAVIALASAVEAQKQVALGR